MNHSRVPLYLVFAFLAGIILVACSSATSQPSAPVNDLPDFVINAPADVKTAYEYAASHPDELAKYPCYCGCGKMGHTSNRSCYIKDIAANGKITFDDHASGCGICVDITKDVMRMKAEGKTSREIRNYVDAKYSQYGPGTDTAMPTD